MERQVVGVELLVSREKLMAGLPTYATYFGRDMLMTALMMQPIWRHTTLEAVIAATLRKLGPDGGVSHEEAVGDQAVRESAGEYARRVNSAQAMLQRNARDDADAELARAERALQSLRTPRENYHMIDDEYQFAIVVARWITDPSVPAVAKRAFLRDTTDGGVPRAERLMQALALVAELTAPYVSDARAANLIGFRPGPPLGWGTASWRDSGAGYAGGRYAMDINAIWVPHALEATGQILRALRELDVMRTGVPSAARRACNVCTRHDHADTCDCGVADSAPTFRRHAVRRRRGACDGSATGRDAGRRAGVLARAALYRHHATHLPCRGARLGGCPRSVSPTPTRPRSYSSATASRVAAGRHPQRSAPRRWRRSVSSCALIPLACTCRAWERWWRTTPTPRRRCGRIS